MARTTRIERFDAAAFTSHILDTMKQRGTTHEALAVQTGLALGIVSRMRRDGRRPTADAFLALCYWSNTDPMRFHIPPSAGKPAAKGNNGHFAGLMR